ncbi:MAG: hypothetical protein KAG97_11400, partial [Victivallales bacterium]|nr:hypothetical protein [Victivallales bacterium]
MKKKTKILLWCGVATFAVILLPVGIAIFTASAILDEKPFPLSERTPDPKALKSALRKLDTFSKTKSGEKQDWTKIVSNFLLNPIQTVSLNQKEVNALIDAGLVEAHAKALAKRPDVVLADASFNGKRFSLKVSKNVTKELERDTPFGHFINVSMECELGVS